MDEKELLEAIESETNPYKRAEMIASLSDDKHKIELLKTISGKTITADENRVTIISSLSDDNTKKELLETMGGYARACVIASFSDDTVKKEFLETITDDYYRATIIASLDDDTVKKEFLENITDEDDRITIIESLSNDEDKIELLETMPNKYDRAKIVATLSDDEYKIGFLKETALLLAPYQRAEVIASLDSVSEKIGLLISITDVEGRANIIESILADADEEEKRELLEAIDYDWIDNKDNKWKNTVYDTEFYYEQEKSKVMASLREDESKAKETEEKVDTLEGLSIEELSAMDKDLDKQIEENEKAIQEEKQKKALIDQIRAKRAKVEEQQAELNELQQEQSIGSQQH